MRSSKLFMTLLLLTVGLASARELPEFLDVDPNAPAYQRGAAYSQEALNQAVRKFKAIAKKKGYEPKVDPAYLLVSNAMPQGVLKNYYLSMKDLERPVVLVLRGFKPRQLKKVIRPFYKITKGKMDVPIQIDPTLFRNLNIELVPALVARDDADIWRVARGDAPLETLFEAIEKGDTEHPLGKRYPIKEPDLLAVIHERIKAIDWAKVQRQMIARAKERILRGGVQVPVAQSKQVTWVDPTVTTSRAIRNPKTGAVLIPAGYSANPLDYIGLTRAYALFDPTDPGQLEVIREWQKTHDNLSLIATHYPSNTTALSEITNTLDAPVMRANQLLVKRLNITSIPALITQDGSTIKVVSVPPKPPEASP